MPKSEKTEHSNVAALPFGTSDFLSPYVLQFLKAQDASLKEAETFASRWFDRRRTASANTLDAARQLARVGTDVSAAQAILQDWQAQSVERLSEDASDWVALWRDCVNLYVSGQINAEADVIAISDTSKGSRKLPTRIPV